MRKKCAAQNTKGENDETNGMACGGSFDFWYLLTQLGKGKSKTKLGSMRHTTKEEGLARYIARSVENLEEWQKVQRNPVFHDCEFIIGFRGEAGRKRG